MSEDQKKLSMEEMGRLAMQLLREHAEHDPLIAERLAELGLDQDE
jgi:hypothetical protein